MSSNYQRCTIYRNIICLNWPSTNSSNLVWCIHVFHGFSWTSLCIQIFYQEMYETLRACTACELHSALCEVIYLYFKR